jgi:hypothetical protein
MRISDVKNTKGRKIIHLTTTTKQAYFAIESYLVNHNISNLSAQHSLYVRACHPPLWARAERRATKVGFCLTTLVRGKATDGIACVRAGKCCADAPFCVITSAPRLAYKWAERAWEIFRTDSAARHRRGLPTRCCGWKSHSRAPVLAAN